MPLRTLILCYFSQVAKNVLVSTFLVNHIFSSKYMFTCYYSAGKYWSLERPKEVPSNVPRTSPKHPVWPSRGRYHLAFWGSPDLTSRIILTGMYFGRRSQALLVPSEDVLRTWWGRLLDISKFNFTFFSKLNAILWGVFRIQSSI